MRTLEAAVGATLLERGFPSGEANVGRTQLTEAGLALAPRAIAALGAQDALFAPPTEPDPREMDRILAALLLELAVKALRHDLSDEDRALIVEILPD